jgi:ketosteroid isomerase-like protein
MKRRELIAAAAAGITFGIARTGSGSADDERLIRQLIKDCYSVFYTERDKHKYQSLLTEDYLLLEKGEILDAEHDIGMMPSPGSDYERTDAFDFRRVRVQEDTAYVIYVVKSEITNKKNVRQNGVWEFLESAILRRSGKRWRIALIHSTQITKPGL